jgi:predicted RNA methylase
MSDVALEPRVDTRATPAGPTAAPAAGRPFTTEAARWNTEVLHAEELIRGGLARSVDAPALVDPGLSLSSGRPYESAIHRAARRLAAAWLSGVLVGDLSPSASLLDAESWFCGAAPAAATLPIDCARHAQAVLERLARDESALAMLPYALDPNPHEYRRDVVKGSDGRNRSTRKASGSFFTPADVVDHIVNLALTGADVRHPTRVLDPAAGTGVFLRSAFAALMRHGFDADDALAALFGIDIDERSVDMAAFVLLVDYSRAGGQVSSQAEGTWWSIRSALLAADTLTTLSGKPVETTLFHEPEHDIEWLRAPFDAIVGNPPYARVGRRPDLADFRSRYRTLEHASESADIYPAFVELLCGMLSTKGAGAMVVPMSIGYSTTQQLRELRVALQEAGGELGFEFFDRTPDALFGDDVKQRTAIVSRRVSDSYSLVTGPVRRWTSRNRWRLFDQPPSVPVGAVDITSGVPKLGSAVQADAYTKLRSDGTALEASLVRTVRISPPIESSGGHTVYVAGTAYNWLNVYRTAESITRGVDRPTASPLTALEAASDVDAAAIFALLSSRVAYWVWRVETDVFHVPVGWLRGIPLSLEAFDKEVKHALAQLGDALWTRIEEYPVRSLNGGTTTVSYCPHAAPAVLDEIDEMIVEQYGLPEALKGELATFVRDLATAGRDDDTEHGLRRALASWREG